jgi:hypothetical protein
MRESAVSTKFRDRSRPRRISAAIRVVGLCLFALYLIRGPIGVDAIVDQLRELRPEIWLLACGCNLVPPLVIALRLKCLLRMTGHEVPYFELAPDSLRAAALNTVALMGTGDLYRVNRLHALGVPLSTGGALAVLDRLFGIAALVAMVLVFQVTGLGRTLDGTRAGIGFALLFLAALLVALAVMRIRIDGWVGERLAPLRDLLSMRPLPWRPLAEATALSFAACAAWIFCVYLLGQGLGLSIPIVAYIEAAPLVALATFLPITIGGVGLREAGYVLLLGSYGVSPSAAISLGVAQYSTFLAIAVLGGLFFAVPARAIAR